MTPDKRATLLKVLVIVVASGLLIYGYIAPPEWLAAMVGVG